MKRVLMVLVLCLLLMGCSQTHERGLQNYTTTAPTNLTPNRISTQINTKTNCSYSKVEVYFYYSPYCPHCERVLPYINELREKYRDVKWIYCNVSGNVSKACYKYAYYVVGTPTVVVHYDNVTLSLVGERDVMGLEKVIKSLACCER